MNKPYIERLIAFGDCVVCKKMATPASQIGRIHVPDTAKMKNNVQYLVVVAVGPDVIKKDMMHEGDRLIVKEFANATLDDGSEAGFVREKEILAILPKGMFAPSKDEAPKEEAPAADA